VIGKFQAMIAFDTNLLVRTVVADDPLQVAIVRQLIAQDAIWISRTVLLETEWVLRTRYLRSQAEMLEFFRALLELDNTEIEDASAVEHALEWYAMGADFADALHLAVCGSAVMHTFDQRFCRAARKAGLTPEIRVLQNGHS
jgi:predicted nucleic-acid-binding protein